MNNVRRISWPLCWLLFALLVLPQAAAGQSRSVNTDDLDRYVTAMMAADNVPGVALAIVYRDQVIYERGYGTDGAGHQVTPDTGFILGSMSKSFTALAVMQLVERGALDLDTPAQHYLPWFRVADADASASITIRQLLTHTSGIPADAPQATGANTTLQDQVRALAAVKVEHAPGTAHVYSSPNYLVLGAIIEQVTGRSYAQVIQENIFGPLHMTQSFTDQAEAAQHGMSRGHRYWFGIPVATTLPYESDRLPTAALISSAHDLATYLQVQLNTPPQGFDAGISADGIRLSHQPQAPGEGFAYGFGWRVSQIGGTTAVHHGGIVPHFRGKMVLLPEAGWGVVVLTNASSNMPLPLAPTSHAMADTIAEWLMGGSLTTHRIPQSWIMGAIAVVMLLVVLNQLRGLWRTRKSASRRTLWLSALLGALWPIAALVGLPIVLRVPWSAILQGTPDMAVWLLTIAALGLIGAGRDFWLLWQGQR